MFKRANKITALLVAAASVMSIVPAMAADNTRLGHKSSTVKQGVAFDGGKYAYYGYRGDADTGIWYNNGGDEKDTADSDLADYRFNNDSKYGEKYAYAQENSNDDEYLIDLSTGKIVTDETAEEKADAAQAKLASNIKKADRYKKVIEHTADLDGRFEQILKGQFGEIWYKYDTTTAGVTAAGSTKGVISVTVADATVGTVEIAGKTFIKDPSPLTAGYTSGNKADFSVYAAQNATYGAFDFTSVDTATGEVTLTQTTETTFVQADLDALVTAGANVTAKLVTEGDTAGTITVAGVKAVIKVTPKDFTKDFTFGGKTVHVGIPSTTGYVNKTGLISAVNAASFDDYTAVATAGAGEAVTVVLTQKVGAALNQGNIDAADYTNATPVVTVNGIAGTSSAGVAGYVGFTNESGKYIDASYVANMKIYSTAKGRAVIVDEYNEKEEDAQLTVKLKDIEAIAQDKEFIYTYTTVDVINDDNGTTTEQYFVQKISKAQGSKDADEAYVPKSVDSYQVDNKTIYDNGDMEDAYKVIKGTKDDDFEYLLGVEAKDNALYVTRAKDDKVKVYKLSLKSVKSDIVLAGADLKEDVDTYAVVLSGDKDTDIVEHTTADAASAEDQGLKGIEKVIDSTNGDDITLFGEDVMRHPSVSIDVEGNVWALDKGQIKKITGLDVKNVNTCDRAMDAIDAYNDSSVIAWDISGDAYTTLKEGTKVTEDESTAVAPVIVTGWVQDGANWSFNDTTGAKVTAKWINVGGSWYFLKADGVMATGWYNDNGTWYFLKSSGAMATGWIQDGANWYYLNASGAMLANTTVDGYVLGASGAWVK